MISFKEFLESNMIDPQSNMKLVGGAAKDAAKVGLEAAIDAVGMGFVKNLFQFALKQRQNVVSKIQDDATLNKAKELIRTRITQKAQNRPGNIEAIIESYIGATDESQVLLNDQERKLVIDSIIKAINENKIQSGFTQELVNGILQEKLNLIQRALAASVPKKLVV